MLPVRHAGHNDVFKICKYLLYFFWVLWRQFGQLISYLTWPYASHDRAVSECLMIVGRPSRRLGAKLGKIVPVHIFLTFKSCNHLVHKRQVSHLRPPLL